MSTVCFSSRLNRIQLSLFIFVFIFAAPASAQVTFIGGLNYSYLRNNNLLENQKPILSYHFGGSVRYYPLKRYPKISLQNELIFNTKGYRQYLDREYTFRFNYISLPILINYALTEDVSVHTGVEFSGVVSSNIKRYRETYNEPDIGIVLGFSCFERSEISFFSRMTYGLLPILDYDAMDRVGNFTGKIHDLKNMCLSVGMKIKMSNEKIRIFK